MPQSVVNIPTNQSISKDFYYPDGAGSALKRVCEPRRHSEPCDGAVASFNISVNFELGRGPAPTVTGSYKALDGATIRLIDLKVVSLSGYHRVWCRRESKKDLR